MYAESSASDSVPYCAPAHDVGKWGTIDPRLPGGDLNGSALLSLHIRDPICAPSLPRISSTISSVSPDDAALSGDNWG